MPTKTEVVMEQTQQNITLWNFAYPSQYIIPKWNPEYIQENKLILAAKMWSPKIALDVSCTKIASKAGAS